MNQDSAREANAKSSEMLQSDPTTASSPLPLRCVAIGGGTGLSTLLRGLRRHVAAPGLPTPGGPYFADLAAIVTVTDDGGSSGRLRHGFKMQPPGDIRNCMVALSEEQDLLARLFEHRFRQGGDLEGHNFGNLFLAALTELTGDFGQAIEQASRILATRGKIYPATNSNATLIARMEDGTLVRGETSINASTRHIAELMMDPPDASSVPETLEAIERADLITLGPGSLYTSLITNLLVKDLTEALIRARGTRVYVCNLMTEGNESLGLTASQHIERIYDHTREPIFDYALVNTATFSRETVKRYALESAAPIVPDLERIQELGVKVIAGNFAFEENVVRHNYLTVTDTLIRVAQGATIGTA